MSVRYTDGGEHLRIRIVKLPPHPHHDLEGFDVSQFEMGGVYDVGLRLGELLVVCGYAEFDMRQRDRAANRPAKRKTAR